MTFVMIWLAIMAACFALGGRRLVAATIGNRAWWLEQGRFAAIMMAVSFPVGFALIALGASPFAPIVGTLCGVAVAMLDAERQVRRRS